MSDLDTLTRTSLDDIAAADALDALDAIRVRLLGKSGAVTEQLKALGKLPPDERKAHGERVNRVRDELSLLRKDVEVAQKAMDTTAQRFTETSMEGNSNHSDVSLLSPALPPGSPASPRIGLNIALSMVLGLLLGMGLGLLLELLDRRVRSSSDIANLLRVPVIALKQERPTVTGIRLLPGPSTGRYLPSA